MLLELTFEDELLILDELFFLLLELTFKDELLILDKLLFLLLELELLLFELEDKLAANGVSTTRALSEISFPLTVNVVFP